MTKMLAINGSPRKDKNTARLLKAALLGAASEGVEGRIVNLYDIDYHGCYSCFACKRLGSKTFGTCPQNDGLKPILEEIRNDTDAIVMGSPIYFMHPSAQMLAFQERLFFPYYDYSVSGDSLFPRVMPCGCIYTMNASLDQYDEFRIDETFKWTAAFCMKFFGSYHELTCVDTLQFDDYSKYASEIFSETHKRNVHRDEFPKDLSRAHDMGIMLARVAKSEGAKKPKDE